MDIIFWLVTILSQLIQWVGGKLMRVLVNWWLKWFRRRMTESIIASDFKVSLVTGVDPLKLKFQFKLHNGSATDIKFHRLIIHLFCGGAHVGSVTGGVTDSPFVRVGPSGVNIRPGRKADIFVEIIPNVYLWFWLLADAGYSLETSSVEVSTTWGMITIPLSDNVENAIKDMKPQVSEFLTSIRSRLAR